MHTTGLVFAYEVAIKNGRMGYWHTMLSTLAFTILIIIGLFVADEFLVHDQLWERILRAITLVGVVWTAFLPFACREAWKIARRNIP